MFCNKKYDESKYYEQMCCTKNYNLAHFCQNLQNWPILHNLHKFAYFAQFLQHLHKYSNSHNLHNCQYLHFLAVQNSSIGLIVPPAPLRVLLLLTYRVFFLTGSAPKSSKYGTGSTQQRKMTKYTGSVQHS